MIQDQHQKEKLSQNETVLNNVESIKKQVEKIFEGNVEVVNNYDWYKDVNILDFLKRYMEIY